MSDIETAVRSEFVKFLVQKNIFCGMTGAVLDVRTCVVINDSDGWPAVVMSQEAWQTILSVKDDKGLTWEQVFPNGHSVDQSTVVVRK